MSSNVCCVKSYIFFHNIFPVERLGFGDDIAEVPEFFEWDPNST